jgi:hypothetical protein
MKTLTPRLVPEPLWGLSASRLVDKAVWARIRRDSLAASGGACEICGAVRDRGMILDEDWTYAAGVATLAGFRIVCPDCSGVIHLMRTIRMGYSEVAIDHWMRVNGIDEAEVMRLLVELCQAMEEQRTLAWTETVAPELLASYPELSVIKGQVGRPGEGAGRLLPPKG